MDVRGDANVVAIRIETAPTGWALSARVLEKLSDLGLRYVEIDEVGVRGIVTLRQDADAVAVATRLGDLVRDLPELATLEIREDVGVIELRELGQATVAEIAARLGDAGVAVQRIHRSADLLALVVHAGGLNHALRHVCHGASGSDTVG